MISYLPGQHSRYWKDPGAFVNGGLGFVSVLLTAGFSFQGTEIVGITAGEAKNPTKTVPRAIRNTFWRIIIFYIVTIFLLGLCLPSNDPNLENDEENAATASFTLVFQKAGIDVAAHVINFRITNCLVNRCKRCKLTSFLFSYRLLYCQASCQQAIPISTLALVHYWVSLTMAMLPNSFPRPTDSAPLIGPCYSHHPSVSFVYLLPFTGLWC